MSEVGCPHRAATPDIGRATNPRPGVHIERLVVGQFQVTAQESN